MTAFPAPKCPIYTLENITRPRGYVKFSKLGSSDEMRLSAIEYTKTSFFGLRPKDRSVRGAIEPTSKNVSERQIFEGRLARLPRNRTRRVTKYTRLRSGIRGPPSPRDLANVVLLSFSVRKPSLSITSTPRVPKKIVVFSPAI